MHNITLIIDILISTYNGAKYLREQLDSIVNQTYPYWRIIIRDDGSTDNSTEIINEYCEAYPEKFLRLIDDFGNLGICQSFKELINVADADYIMFADQDNVWFKDKIDISIKTMIEFESKNDKTKPLLIHTDLKVVDEELNHIDESFMKYQGLNGYRVNLNQLVVQNCITGCTVLFNKALKNLIAPLDNHARMHDWWIGINASLFGEIIYIDKPTIYYRQHSSNSVGAKNNNIITYIGKLFKIKKVKNELYLAFEQTKNILKYNKTILNDNQKQLLNDLSHIEEFGFLKKRLVLIKHRLNRYGFISNLGLFIFI